MGIRNILVKMIEWIDRRKYNRAGEVSPKVSLYTDSLGDGLSMTIFRAQGGKVIRTHKYNPTLRDTEIKLYIVTDADDLGNELAQIITMETLSG